MRPVFMSMCFLLSACAPSKSPLPLAEKVDLQRFMGDWYVIANIPTFLESGAHNAVETYRLNPDGSIATTFTFRADSFEGPEKRYEPTGYVVDHGSNAVWGMQFIWPVQADYRIIYLKPDYSQTVIGREARDYVWIMARTPQIPETEYETLLAFLKENGYDVSKLQKVPQRWLEVHQHSPGKDKQ
ncbi:MAG: lipocalin family protein [Gammaproteobacteria bacterium]